MRWNNVSQYIAPNKKEQENVYFFTELFKFKKYSWNPSVYHWDRFFNNNSHYNHCSHKFHGRIVPNTLNSTDGTGIKNSYMGDHHRAFKDNSGHIVSFICPYDNNEQPLKAFAEKYNLTIFQIIPHYLNIHLADGGCYMYLIMSKPTFEYFKSNGAVSNEKIFKKII